MWSEKAERRIECTILAISFINIQRSNAPPRTGTKTAKETGVMGNVKIMVGKGERVDGGKETEA